MTERLLEFAGLELCVETFGNQGDPAVLMIMGATASKGWWPDEMVQRLAAAGRLVLRYDHRDTGRSTAWPPGEPGYTIDDLADDALRILDAHELTSAHVVGMSLGGLIAQLLALRDPQRVRTLTLIASEVLGDPGFEPRPIDPAIMDHFASASGLDWLDQNAVAAFVERLWRLNAAPGRDASPLVARTARGEVRRARSPASMLNHAMIAGAEAWQDRTAEITQPMQIVHGRLDPVVEYRHALALARMARNARLLTLDRAGHELHEADWDAILAAILRQTA